MLARVVTFVLFLIAASTAAADPYPPYWQGDTGPSVHHVPVPWPTTWTPYTSQGVPIRDKRDNDPSNGGTSPQGYVNVSSGCTDSSVPSIYYAYSSATQTLFFRWRVQSPPHTYATGPNAGTFSASSPWSSALWTVLIDIDGDGYRDFAVHLDGSSGSPSASVDRVAAIFSRTRSHSLDYLGDPANVKLLAHNPTAFVDQATDRLLNFQGTGTPTPGWPNGSAETAWDYGTTRATLLGTGCGEYFIDYQIPLAMLDATAVGGPAISATTPIALFFATSNSLTNPLQKDAVTTDAFVAGIGPLPFGDVLVPAGGTVVAPLLLDDLTVTGCAPSSTITTSVLDSRTAAGTTIAAVDFFRYADLDGNGAADDGGTWQAIGAAAPTAPGDSTWSATWTPSSLPTGQYLIGARATDAAVGAYPANTTWGFRTAADLATALLSTPPNYVNPTPRPGLVTRRFANTCGAVPVSLSATITPSSTTVNGTALMTVTVHNAGTTPVTVSQISVPLPAGFSYDAPCYCSLGAPAVQPTAGDTGTLVWSGFSSPTVSPAGGTGTLEFIIATAPSAGAYTITPTAIVGGATVTANAASVELGAASLNLTAVAGTPFVAPGSTLAVTASYANAGTVTAAGTSLVATVPTGFAFQSASGGGTWNAGPRTVTWSIGDLAGLASGSRQFTVVADAPFAGSSPATFPVQLSAIGPVTAHASATVVVDAPGSALGVDVLAADPNIAAGATTALTVQYANGSASPAANAQLSLSIPAGFAFVSASHGGAHAGGTVTWSLGTLAGSATGTVTVWVMASSPWSGLVNPAPFVAALAAASASTATDTQAVGVDYGVGSQVCSTYYFQSTPYTNGSAATTGYLATIAEPASETASTIMLSVTTTPQFVGRFFQGPEAPTDISFNGDLTTYFYVSKTSGPQLKLDARVYDFNPADSTKSLLGTASFTKTGSGTNVEYSFLVPVSGTLLKGHRLLWEFDAYSNNNTNFTFLFASKSATAANNSPSRATFCVQPPATPVLDHDVTPLTVTAGNALTYATRFGNIGRTTMTAAQVAVAVPDGVTVAGATLNGSVTSWVSAIAGAGVTTYRFDVVSSDTATIGQLTGGQSGILQVNATLDAPFGGLGTLLVSTASLESAQTAAVTDSAQTRVLEATLGATLTADRAMAAPGDAVGYTAVVTNRGAAAATGLSLTSTLPAAAYYTYASGSATANGLPVGGASYAASTLTVPLGSLAPGTSVTVRWQMQVAASGVPPGTTPQSLAATATHDSGGTSTGTVTVNTVTVPGLDVQISSSAPHTPALAGDVVTVTATVTSTGGATVTGVDLAAPVFEHGSYVPGSLALSGGPGDGPQTDAADADRGAFRGATNGIAVTLGDMPAGDLRVVTWQVRLDGVLPAGSTGIGGSGRVTGTNGGTRVGNYVVGATASAVTTMTASAPASVALPLTTVTGGSGLQVTVPAGAAVRVGDVVSIAGTVADVLAFDGATVTLSQAVAAAPGTPVLPTVPFDLTCTNAGTATAANAQIVFTLPVGTTFATSTSTGVQSGGGASVTWALGALAPGATAVRQVRVLATAAGDLTGSAVCAFTGGTSVPVTAAAAVGAVVLSKSSASPAPASGASGLEATYVITAMNQRSTAAANVVVTDALAPGLSYAGAVSVTGATPSSAPQPGDTTLQWSGFSIPAHGSVTITFKAALANLAPGTYQNAATGTSSNTGVLPYDETASASEDVVVSAVLGVTAKVQIGVTASSASIVLTDMDLDRNPSIVETIEVVVVNAVSGEQERLTLTETGPSTGVFTGTLPLAAMSGPGAHHDGSMRATGGQTLGLQHLDLQTALGQPVTVSDAGVVPGSPTAPALTVAPGGVTFVAGDLPRSVDPSLTITPGSSATLTSATVTICGGNRAGEDLLSFVPQHGITGAFDITSGTLALGGVAAVAQWQAALRSVAYGNGSSSPTAGVRTVCLQVSDGTLSSAAVSRTVDVQGSGTAARHYYLTEGVTNGFLRTTVLVANPTETAANVRLELYSGDGERRTVPVTVAANARQAFDLATIAQGLTDGAISTVVTSTDGVPLLVEREVEWGDGGYGAHAEQAATELSTHLYFAEGAKEPFSPYLVVLNPGSADARLTIRFLNSDGSAADAVDVVARAGHRETYDLRVIGAAAPQAFGMVLESTEPIAAEHAMYIGDSPTWRTGHGGGSTIAPRTQWYFTEGTTYLDWDTFLLLANPGTTPASVTVQYHVERGPTVLRSYVVAPGARLTVNVGDEAPELAYDHFWTELSSDQPVVAERSVYWTKPWTAWTEGHSSPAIAAPRTAWGFAHGREGLARDAKTYLLLANPSDQPNEVRLRLLTSSGERTTTIVIPARDRVSYHVGLETGLVDSEFWMRLESTSQQPFLVERSLYWSADGRTWTSGTNVTGIAVP